MLIKELIARIQSLYSKGVPSDAIRLSERHVYNKLQSVRMQLLSQQLKKKQVVSDWNYSILPCVELIKVPNHECPCLGDLGCDVYRTKFKIPKVLTSYDKHHISFVMSIENGIRIEEVTRQGVLYLKGNKYTSKRPKYLFENGYLYFPIDKSPGIVKIKLLAENPLEAKLYPSICEDCEDCIDCTAFSDYEFDIDGDLIEPLIAMTAQELLAIFAQMKQPKTREEEKPQEE
jgi:hypothetical protein